MLELRISYIKLKYNNEQDIRFWRQIKLIKKCNKNDVMKKKEIIKWLKIRILFN